TKSAKAYRTPRTPDGVPDLQGVWSMATITPMERPPNLAGKEFFTPEEARQFEKETLDRNNMDRRDGGASADLGGAYNVAWYDRGTRVIEPLRPSLVIDPSDGRIPRIAGQGRGGPPVGAGGGAFDGPESRSLGDRCIVFSAGGPAPPMVPTFY